MSVQTLLAVLALIGTEEAQAQDFQVVVNAAAGTDEISTGDLSKIFQKNCLKRIMASICWSWEQSNRLAVDVFCEAEPTNHGPHHIRFRG